MFGQQRLRAAAVVVLCITAVAGGQQATVERIGPGGGNSSIADDGTVVYEAWHDRHYYLHRYSDDSGDSYFDPGDWTDIGTTKVNSSHQVAFTALSPTGAVSYRYSDTMGLVDINTLGIESVSLTDMNEAGAIVGQMRGSSSHPSVFLYTDQNGLARPDFVDPDWIASIGQAINDSGQIALAYEDSSGTHSSRYTPGAGLVPIGSFGGRHTVATGMNNQGDITGWAMIPEGGYHAFLYSDVGGLRDLDLGGGVHEPVDVNDDQWVLAYGNEPSLWTPNTGWVTLDSLIPDTVDAQFYDLLSINNAGQIIGMGRLGDSWGTLRMTIHSIPTTPSLATLALAVGLTTRRRRH